MLWPRRTHQRTQQPCTHAGALPRWDRVSTTNTCIHACSGDDAGAYCTTSVPFMSAGCTSHWK